MIPENIKSLITGLIEKTNAKRANWDKTSRPNEFKLHFDMGAVTTDNWYDDSENEYVDFAIYNSLGDRIDVFSVSRNNPDYQEIIRLHTTAKKEYYKVDETINGLLDEIKSDKNIGLKRTETNDDLPF